MDDTPIKALHETLVSQKPDNESTDDYRPLDDPFTREYAEVTVIDTLRSIGGEDPQGWEHVLDNTLRHTRQHLELFCKREKTDDDR